MITYVKMPKYGTIKHIVRSSIDDDAGFDIETSNGQVISVHAKGRDLNCPGEGWGVDFIYNGVVLYEQNEWDAFIGRKITYVNWSDDPKREGSRGYDEENVCITLRGGETITLSAWHESCSYRCSSMGYLDLDVTWKGFDYSRWL